MLEEKAYTLRTNPSKLGVSQKLRNQGNKGECRYNSGFVSSGLPHSEALHMLFNWKSPGFIEGARMSAPSQFGMGAWGLVVGVAMIKAGLTLPQALGMTLLVFAGSAQLAALPLMAAHAPIWVIFVTALIVNLRFLIMSALIAPRFAHLHWFKRTVMGFFTGDITVALFMNRFPQMWSSAAEEREQRDFLKGLVVPNWFVWQITSIIGILLGSQVPTHWGLGFAGTLAILCVMLPLVQNRPAIGGVVLASVVAVLAHALPYKLGLLLAVILGMGFAMWLEEHVEADNSEAQPDHGNQT